MFRTMNFLSKIKTFIGKYLLGLPFILSIKMDKDSLFLMNQFGEIVEQAKLDDIIEIKYGRYDAVEYGLASFWDVITKDKTFSFPELCANVGEFRDYFKIKHPSDKQLGSNRNITISIWKKKE